MVYKQLVLIDYDNTGAFVEWFTSNKPIKIEDVSKCLEARDGADWDRDTIMFLDNPTSTKLITSK